MRMIGISPTLDEETGRITVNSGYPDSIRRAGAVPVLLPLYGDAPEIWDEMIAHIDGLILTGGCDVNPAIYGEERIPQSNVPSLLRDQVDMALCRRALEADMPILGICRGIQMLNCALGGTLYQDLPSQLENPLRHAQMENRDRKVHSVVAEPESMIVRIIGQECFDVNSVHHQAVKTVGPGVAVTAHATDGVIEGIEAPGKKFVLGVQWHPEILGGEHAEKNPICAQAQAIFDHFVRACETYTAPRQGKMKVIGLTPSWDDQKNRVIVNQDYLDAIRRAGALPVLFPLYGDDPDIWDGMLENVDGLLLTGGADVGPDTYGEEKLPLCGETAPKRDRQEFYLCKKALEKDLPILAICRGHQVLNCALGGKLYQDIENQYGPELKHPRYEVPRDQVHFVTLEKDSLIHQITGKEQLHVNSRHHQAIKQLGEGLKVTARAEDGLIEGVEMPGKKFVLGVQWHPESLSDYVPDAQALFNAFVKACGGKE